MDFIKNNIIKILLIVSGVLVIMGFLAPIIFTNETSNSRFDFTNTGQIGDTIGGLMNPFIALAGVFITFLAFYMQLKANEIQIRLFNKTQTDQAELLKEQLFFRLYDNLQTRILNFSFTEIKRDENKIETDRIEHNSFKALDYLTNRFYYKIDYKCISLGRHLLALMPEKIDSVHYIKILQATTMNEFPKEEVVDEFQKAIINKATYNERWEYLKVVVGSTDSKNTKCNQALQSIGRVQFYKIPFSEKEQIYITAYDEIYNEYGGFLDGYFKNLTYLTDFVVKSKNTFFVDYLKSNLSNQELVLIYYFCSSRHSSGQFRKQVKELDILEHLHSSRNRFVDSPSEEELNNEKDEILKESVNR
ncbi:MAG: hypothetical protein IT190_07905 [Microbacteriaceae bacterium]|nr:hypothetical protein [Microbacteriaceae bacterium]